jgi:hypothetical protein
MHSLQSHHAAARSLLTLLGLTTCALVAAGEPEKGMIRDGGARALLIGVADYNDPTIPDLAYSDRDIYALAETLLRSGHYSPDDLIVMTTDQPSADRRPTKFNLQVQLEGLAEVQGASTLLVYFSGHGVGKTVNNERQNFLFPEDTDDASPHRLGETSLSAQWLQSTLQRMTGFRAHALLMDACRSSPDGEKSVLNQWIVESKSKSNQRLDVRPSGPDLQVVYSAAFGDPSYEDATLQMSQFTYAVIRGLEGEADGQHFDETRVPDGWVTVSELQAFAANTLRAMERVQLPYLSGEYNSAVVIAPSQPSVAERRRAVRCPVARREVAEAAEDALRSYNESTPAEFLRAAERVTWLAECADDVLPIEVIGDLHRVNALRAFLVQDHRTMSLTLSTLYDMGFDPLEGVPAPSAELQTVARNADIRREGSAYIGHPSGVEVWVNGRLTNERPAHGVAFVQIQNWDGSMQPGAWLRPEQPIPAIAAPPSDAWLRPTQQALGWGAGVSALAGAGFLACNLLQVSSFNDVAGQIAAGEGIPEDPEAHLEELQRRANACATGAWVSGSFAAVLGGTSVGLRVRF